MAAGSSTAVFVEQQPGELPDEEGVPTGALVEHRCELLACDGVLGGGKDIGGKGRDVLGPQPAQADLTNHLFPGDRCQRGVQGVRAVTGEVAVRHHHQQRPGRERGREVGQQLEARQVGPVHVVEGDDGRAAVGDALEEHRRGLVQGEPQALQVVAGGRDRQAGAFGDDLGQLGHQPRRAGAGMAQLLLVQGRGHAVQDLGPRPERGCTGRGRRPAGVDREAAAAGHRVERVDERGLADARLAGDQQEGALAGEREAVEVVLDDGELSTAANNPEPRDRAARGCGRGVRAGGRAARGLVLGVWFRPIGGAVSTGSCSRICCTRASMVGEGSMPSSSWRFARNFR